MADNYWFHCELYNTCISLSFVWNWQSKDVKICLRPHHVHSIDAACCYSCTMVTTVCVYVCVLSTLLSPSKRDAVLVMDSRWPNEPCIYGRGRIPWWEGTLLERQHVTMRPPATLTVATCYSYDYCLQLIDPICWFHFFFYFFCWKSRKRSC